jgi:phospholipase/carboxylesterase
MRPAPDPVLSRRDALRALGAGTAAVCTTPMLARALGACAPARYDELGRLRTRHAPATESTAPGTHPLGLRETRDGVLYLPARYEPTAPMPLMLLLHGAGGSGAGIARRFSAYADELGIAFVAPDSTEISWDRADRLTKDVAHIDAALRVAYRRIATTPDRVRIGGFSDGASYSLSVGLTNGDLFGRILALSPGFMDPAQTRGKPEIYITHGVRDDILPIDRTSRRIVPVLRNAGYTVHYHEFDGRHEAPREICRPGFEWLIGG